MTSWPTQWVTTIVANLKHSGLPLGKLWLDFDPFHPGYYPFHPVAWNQIFLHPWLSFTTSLLSSSTIHSLTPKGSNPDRDYFSITHLVRGMISLAFQIALTWMKCALDRYPLLWLHSLSILISLNSPRSSSQVKKTVLPVLSSNE